MSLLPRPTAHTDALVLRTWPCGETSAVASLLTREHGFVKVIAKAARRPRSRLRPLIEPGRLVEVEFALDPARELQYLRGGSVLLDSLGAEPSLERSAYLLAALELVDRCRPAAGMSAAQSGLFDVCEEFIRVLDSPTCPQPAWLFFRLEWRLLERQGLAPRIEACAGCGTAVGEIAGAPWFDAGEGGLACSDCAAGDGDRRSLSGDALAGLQDLDAGRPEPPARFETSAALRREIGGHLHRFLGYHLPGYRLPTALDLLRAGKDGG
ncbi:MAG: DNA repair protein RecO [bacterium]|nr:DNA repair protein RecO [bacterium]